MLSQAQIRAELYKDIPPDADPHALSEAELRWTERQPFLEARGYQLRPRYRPGWVRSWTGDVPWGAEDSIFPLVSCLTTARGNVLSIPPSSDTFGNSHGRHTHF